MGAAIYGRVGVVIFLITKLKDMPIESSKLRAFW